MLVLRQFVIVASGCVLGAIAVGIYLTATGPAASRSLDYLLTAILFLLAFAAGTALAGRFTANAAVMEPTIAAPAVPAKPVLLGELAPLRATTAGRDLTKAG
jgi:hypothetical protein